MSSLFGKGSRRTSPRRGLSAFAFGMALLFAAPMALSATEEETAGARAMAQQGLDAFKAKRFKEAADFFTRAESLVHSPVHLLYKARAHAAIGELVKAQEAYIKVIRERLPANAPEAFRNAQDSSRNELEGIKPRLAHLTVTIIGPTEGAKLTVDGDEIPAGLVGVPMPVDPGEHQLEASAEGFTTDTATIKMAESQREGIELRLEAVASPPPVVAPATDPGSVHDAGSLSLDDAGSGQGLRITSYVAFGVGAVGLGLGTVFLLDGNSKSEEADELFEACGGSGCSQSERDVIIGKDEDADSATNFGIAGLALGGVGVAAGVVLFILSGDSDEAASNGPRVTPWVGYNSAGVRGTF